MSELLYYLEDGGIAPLKATEGSAAYDLLVPETEPRIAVFPGHVTTLDLRIRLAIPEGHCGVLLPRSGMGAKKGLALANTFGLIDSDYRGSLIAKLILGPAATEKSPKEPLILRAWEPILQIFILPIPKLRLVACNQLPDPGSRGDGGFGHSTAGTMETAKNARSGKDSELHAGQDAGQARGKALDSRPLPAPSGSEK